MLVLAQIHPAVTASLIAVFLFVCVLLILAVLIQRPAGGGLSGAFGSGAGSGQTAFGAKTGDALTIATIAIFTVYLLFAAGLNYAARPAVIRPAAEDIQTPPPATIPTADPTVPPPPGQTPAGEAIPPAAQEPPATPGAGEDPGTPETPPTGEAPATSPAEPPAPVEPPTPTPAEPPAPGSGG